MLRNVLIAIGAVALLCGSIALATGAFPPAMVFCVWGAILVLAVLVERFRYKPIAASRPGPGCSWHQGSSEAPGGKGRPWWTPR